MANTRKSERSKDKPSRVPFGAARSKLQVEEIPGYVLRWFNDMDGRVERAIEGGYEYVKRDEIGAIGEGALHQDNTDLNSRVSKVVSRGTDRVVRAVLMKIKKQWYNEDQKAKEAVNRQIDDAIRGGSPGGNVVENQYVPKGHKQQI